MKFLGHIVSVDGCRPNPASVTAVSEMKVPTTVKEVRSFLGMCGFYRKHVPGFAKLALPLTNLTKKSQDFIWGQDCQKAFEHLKDRLTQAPILARANPDEVFVLTTDASDWSVGGVLTQRQSDGTAGVLGYFSKKLSDTEYRYSATDK